MKLPLRWQAIYPLVAAMIVSILVFALVFIGYLRVQDAQKRLAVTNGALQDVEVLFLNLMDAEAKPHSTTGTASPAVMSRLATLQGYPAAFAAAGISFEQFQRAVTARNIIDEVRGYVDRLETVLRAELAEQTGRIQSVTSTTIGVAAAGFALTFVLLATGIVQLSSAFNQKSAALDSLKKSEERYQMLSERLQTIQEEERASIAREIHDQIGQCLTAIKISLSSASASVPPATREAFAYTSSLCDEAVRTSRQLSAQLRPPILDHLGLVAALEWYVGEFGKRGGGVQCKLTVSEDEPELSAPEKLALFRIAQEALTNVVRHAQAQNAHVILQAGEKTTELIISDDGVGIDMTRAELPASLGMLGMQERARLVGAVFVLDTNPGNGVTIRVSLPKTNRSARAHAS